MRRVIAATVLLAGLVLAGVYAPSPVATSPAGEKVARLDSALSCDSVRAARLLVEPASDLDAKIGAQIEQIQSTPWRPHELDRLGWLFIAKARRSQNSRFYSLALQTAECMHRVGGDQASALLLEGHSLYSVHRFREAAAVATRLAAIRRTPFDYGLLGDTLLSQGEVEQAAAAYQRMMDLKPSLQSYSRAAQIRWLTGDLDGARELMAMAARSGTERDPETLAWTLSELARLELIAGNASQAHTLVGQALHLLPDHSTSLLVRGRIELAAANPPKPSTHSAPASVSIPPPRPCGPSQTRCESRAIRGPPM